MQRKTISLFSLIGLGLILIGCNRGCTTAKTLASEVRTFSTSGGDIVITGRVVDYRHSRPVNRNILNRSITHSYGLSFDIKFGDFENEDCYTEGVQDPNLVNLTEELKRVKVDVSRDKNHLALGVDGKVVDLVHLFDSHRITTNQQSLLADGKMDWSNLDINSYPSAEEILTETLTNSCDILMHTDGAMYAFCDSKKPSDKIHSILLEKWPECDMAKNYYTEKRVATFAKNYYWKKKATNRGLDELKQTRTVTHSFDNLLDFTLALNSPELNEAMDSILVAKWGDKLGVDYTEALIKRIDYSQNPLNKNERKQVYSDAKNEFNRYLQSGKSNRKREASNCIKVLIALGDTMSMHKFVQAAFKNNPKRFVDNDFTDVAYTNFSKFTDYQQQYIIAHTEAKFDQTEPTHRSLYYSRITQLVDCGLLIRLKKKYPKDLEFSMLPYRCKEGSASVN